MTAQSHADVVGLVIRQFSQQPVAEQARLRGELEKLVGILAGAVPEADRIVLESLDGFAIVVLRDPVDSLRIAERAVAQAGALPLCIGVNRGPIRLSTNASGITEAVGDGVVSAMTLSKLATRGRFLVSRSFRDAFAQFAPARAGELSSVGSFTDDSIRTHELFAFDPLAQIARRRRTMFAAALAIVAILGTGIAAHVWISAARRPGVILFDITPRGAIFVDGEPRGETPPLTRLEVRAGTHTIEVRSPPHLPLHLQVTLRPGQEMSVTHVFAAARERPKKEENLLGKWRRKLGL